MNPYAERLRGQHYLEVLTATPSAVASAIQQIGDAGLSHSYAPGKWTAHQIVCHLADCEVAFGFRIRQAFVQDPHFVQPFNQDDWASSYRSLDPHMALAASPDFVIGIWHCSRRDPAISLRVG